MLVPQSSLPHLPDSVSLGQNASSLPSLHFSDVPSFLYLNTTMRVLQSAQTSFKKLSSIQPRLQLIAQITSSGRVPHKPWVITKMPNRLRDCRPTVPFLPHSWLWLVLFLLVRASVSVTFNIVELSIHHTSQHHVTSCWLVWWIQCSKMFGILCSQLFYLVNIAKLLVLSFHNRTILYYCCKPHNYRVRPWVFRTHKILANIFLGQ